MKTEAQRGAGSVPRFELAPGYSVARVINGCWQLAGGHGGGDPADLAGRLDRLVAAGFTTFDCADIYTGVEELLGRLGKGRSIEVHTKYVPDLEELPRLRRRDVERGVDRSLARLGVERLDLVQFHWWDYGVPGYVEVAGWLGELVAAGKIRRLGVTNFDARRLEEMLATGAPIVSNQTQYSLLDRRAAGEMTDLATRRGLGLLCYGALAGGFVSDGWRGRPEPAADANRSHTKYRLIVDELGGWSALQEILEALAAVASRHGVTSANVAARWVLEQPAVGAVILGLGRGDRVAENQAIFAFDLDEEDHRRLDAVLARHPGPSGPVFGLEREPGGRHEVLLKKNLQKEGV